MATAPTTPATPKAEKTPISMLDGRTVDFTAKQRLNKESTIGEDGSISGRFDFRNGKTINFSMPSNLVSKFAAHGMEQKIGDSIAGEKDLDDAYEAMNDLVARLSNGEWTATRQAGAFAGSSILIKALFELRGATTDEDRQKLKAWLDGKSQAEKLALRKSDALRPIVEKLEAEKAANAKPGTAVDTTSLLAELDGPAVVADEAAPKSKKTSTEG